MKLTQWLRRKLIATMGSVYVWLDKGLTHPTGSILGVGIDDDFATMGRRYLCRHIEKKFGWDEDSFWSLESTQKIRLCCQQARDIMLMIEYLGVDENGSGNEVY